MAKTKKCKYCREEIDKGAKVCPHCQKKQKGKKWLIIAAVVFLIVLVGALGSGKGEEKSGQIDSGGESTAVEESREYSVGEYVEKNDVKVSFISVKNNNGSDVFQPESGNIFVYAEVEIENNSDKELNISSVMCVDAYFDGYSVDESLSALAANSSAKSLDGTIAPGKKLKGTLAYEVSSDWNEFEFKINPDFWDSDGITFTADSSQAE